MLNTMLLQLAARLQSLRHRDETERDSGVTAVEYGILVGVLAVIIFTAAGLVGGGITNAFNDAVNSLK